MHVTPDWGVPGDGYRAGRAGTKRGRGVKIKELQLFCC